MNDDAAPKLDKPEGLKVGWAVQSTRYPLRTEWMTLRQDTISIKQQPEITYTYVEAPPAVFVVPVTSDGQVVLIRQYRYPVDAWCLEVPAGGTHDFPGVSLEDVARTEIREEIGGVCGEVTQVGMFYNWLSKSTQRSHIFLALDVELSVTPRPQITENITISLMRVEDALAMARRGEIIDGQCALSLLLCESPLRQRGIIS